MRKTYLLLIFMVMLSLGAFAQQRQYSTTDKEAIKYFAQANQSIDEHLYDEAITQLKQAIKADPKFIEAHAQLGEVLRMRRIYKPAINQFLKVIELDPEYNRSVYLKVGEIEITSAMYEPAQRHLEKYLTYPNITAQNQAYAQKLIADCRFSIQALTHPVAFVPINMGAEINTANDEYLPVATADEGTLIFTRKIDNNEDFYKSIKLNNNWQNAEYLSNIINTPMFNEGAQSISQDGKYLFFTGCNRPDGLGRCDIYIAQKKGDDWAKPFSLGNPVNTSGWEAQPSISANGRTLYFVSNRKGGYGGYDIWKSTLSDKGWGVPENMGPEINTAYDEQSPFIHPDDSTFYFCSNGWPGMGGKDLFISRLGKDGKWQKPENLGYPINTSGDENGLTLTANGSYAFFSSNNLKGFGGYDIYTFELPLSLRPNIVTYVKGTVADKNTKAPLEAAVEIIDLQKNNPVFQDYSSADGGEFLATLGAGKNYGLNISREGYLFYSDNFSLIGLKDKKAFNISVLLSPIEVGNKVILKNIFFDSNKFELKAESKAELQKLVEFLQLNPTVKIEIAGYTDNVGNEQANVALSEKRANAVYQYLSANGIVATRLVYKGYGEAQPIAPNTTEDNRALNRRTEFMIIAK
ncbi:MULTISPECIES: OmpA family protein [unclassified Mucilaginibacter]|uniref:OmpA family protein n=1 Tax=unclassified Mucilaginibacter TaxID=2617802 RepID=UPI002AC96A3B|nr:MULTISPECIES: OmpA family protein [unclassified Mucilaginibacter]MEB0262335.1 OmpA family protein [Mucilaginibacter sp. 10I4]MEB0279982.1 OmpA family protein [Mucilaginibacter sp. 10B2]MEB0302633.1 OmpA family protein [Mucilaginibacter sp. 5C4]WPX21939.1 OmpA family protein [Mucilaginibacter sp. 5C4]